MSCGDPGSNSGHPVSDAMDEKVLARGNAAMEELKRQHPLSPDLIVCMRLCGVAHDGWHSYGCPIGNKLRRATQ